MFLSKEALALVLFNKLREVKINLFIEISMRGYGKAKMLGRL